MQISFDPNDPKELAIVRKLIGNDVSSYCLEEDCDDQGCPAHYATPPSGVDSAAVFAGNAAVNAAHSPPQAQTGAASADPAPQAGQLEFDSAGIPWDERIHASTKATNKDGSWRNKKGVDKELVKQVTDELRAQHSATSHATVPPAPQQQGTHVPAPAAQQQGTQVPAPPAAQQQGTQVPPPPAAQQPITTFPEFMKAVVDYMRASNITMVDVNNILSSTMGISTTAMLASDPSRIPEAVQNLGL